MFSQQHKEILILGIKIAFFINCTQASQRAKVISFLLPFDDFSHLKCNYIKAPSPFFSVFLQNNTTPHPPCQKKLSPSLCNCLCQVRTTIYNSKSNYVERIKLMQANTAKFMTKQSTIFIIYAKIQKQMAFNK